jgi:putative ABC transport system substrate-binding protein
MHGYRTRGSVILAAWVGVQGLMALALGLVATPVAAAAQPPGKIPRIGIVLPGSPEAPLAREVYGAFRQGLRDLGYVEGQNIAVEERWAQGRVERFPDLVAELVRLKVDLIVAPNTPTALAAKQATSTIPIVVPVMADPVADGLVASLARPGGNITGSTFLAPELVPKRLQLLKEAVPGASRVAVLYHPGVYSEHTMTDMLKGTEGAARTLGVQLQLLGAQGPDDFDRAFSAMRRGRAEALILFPSPMLFYERSRIVDLAAKHRLPAIYHNREAVEAGGLMGYGASIPGLYRGAATYVDKILKGRKPADLPVEQPTRFELVLNMKTAKALGITFPQSILVRADQVIQ